jgi:hypothetical protein
MAQNYNIGNLGQKLTVDLAGNVVSLSTVVNASALSVGSAALIVNSSQITIGDGIELSANGSLGTAGQVLTSNGPSGSPYWSTVTGGGGGSGTVTSISTSNGIGGGTITTSGTLYAVGNTGIVANTTGLFVNATYIGTISANNASYLGGTIASSYLANTSAGLSQNTSGIFIVANTGIVVNATGTFVNATYIGTISSNNASYLGGTAAASYQLNSTLNANIASYLPTYTGVVNGSTLSVGTAFTANATLVNAAAINVVNQTNTSTLYVTTSSNVASAVQSNSTGVWTTGTVNAATHSVGSGFVANTSVLNTNTDLSLTVNNKQLRFATVNASACSYFIQQNDDNFVLYTTNTSYGARAVWSIYANSITSNLNISVRSQFSGGLYIPSGATLLDSTGSQGTTGQVLASNGSGNVYWVSPGAASVNTAAQFTWTNTQTFSANISFTGNNISLVTNTGAVLFAGSADNNWKIGRNTGATTKFYYTNNSIDIIAANSNLEGIAFGWTGNSYLETGYAGTFTRNPIYVGNATVNLAINSTSIVGNNITLGSANTAVFYNYNGQVNATADFRSTSYLSFSGYGGNYLSFGQQTNFHQWIQSGFSSAGSPVYYSIILNPLGGNVGIGNTAPTDRLSINGTTYFGANLKIAAGISIIDSTGSQGTAGQVLTSNGASNVYWSSGGSGTVTSVATGNGMTGGTITTTGTVSVLANTGIVANATGTFVNATYIGTISSNNASYLGGTAAASYQLNSTLNANIASYLPTYAGVVNASAFTTTGNANAANHYSGANALFSAASIAWTGNTTTSPTITLANTGAFTIGNSTTTQTGGSILIANSIGNVAISVNQIGLGNSSSQLNLTSTSILMGTSGSTAATGQISVANSTGNVQITAGTTSILATGIINAASHTVGTVFTANATMTNTVSLVVSTNTATIGTGTYFVSNGNVGIGTSTPGTKLVISPSSLGTGIAPFNKIRLFDDGANNVFGLGMVSGYMDIGYSGGLRFNYNSLTTNVSSTFATFTSNQLTLNGTDGTAALLLSGATRGVRIFPSSSGTYIEGVDNTGVGSYQSLILGGSQVSMTISNVEKFKVDSSGNVTMPSQPMCTVNHVASVTTYATYAPIQFTATGGYDPRSMFSVSAGSYYRITVPVAGRYMIHANFLRDVASLGPLDLSLKKNGTQIYRIYNSNWAGYDDACMNAIVNCAASDYFDIINVNTIGSGGGSIMIYGDSTYVGGQWTVYLIG